MKIAKWMLCSLIVSGFTLVLLTSIWAIGKDDTSATATYTVSGTVVNSDGKPIDGALVHAENRDVPMAGRLPFTRADSEGHFILDRVLVGTNVIYAEKVSEGYAGRSSIAYNGRPATVQVGEGKPEPNVTISVGEKGDRITGEILDSKTHARLNSNAKLCFVESLDNCFFTSLNEDGTFDLFVPTDRPFTLTFLHPTHADKVITQKDSNGVESSILIVRKGEKRTFQVFMEPK